MTAAVAPRRPASERDIEATAEVIRRGRTDPVWWVRTFLGEDLWETQQAILRAVFEHRRVAVKACHSSGKTRVAASVVLAFFHLFPGCKILTTAPTWLQVEKLLWSEIRTLHAKLPKDMGGELLTTELRGAPDWWALGLSTDEGVRFQGHHALKVLIVLDEAPGVKPDIWEAIEGIRAGGDVHVLALGNPTVPSGPFYDAFGAKRSSWRTFTIDAFDTPNLQGLTLEELLALPEHELGVSERPYLVTRRWVREMYDEWGTLSPLWAARVRGQFPDQGADSLLPLSWLEMAEHAAPVDDGGPVLAGLDVAGPGEDETVLCVRRGGNILSIQHWAHADPRGEVVRALEPYLGRLERVNVDTVGIGYYMGQHLIDVLREKGLRDAERVVQHVNVGLPASDSEQYANLKAEFYWGLRQWFRDGHVAGLQDGRTFTQLSSIRYGHTPRGQVKIESKDEALKHGVKSPDRAEAVMLAFASPASPGLLGYYRSVVEQHRKEHPA